MHRRDFLTAGAAAALALPASAAQQRPPEQPARGRFGLGIVTYNIAADWDLDTILRVCRAAGVGAVEYRTTHKHGIEPSLSPAQRKEVRRKIADSGVVMWGCGSTCEFHAADPKIVQQNIDTCRTFIQLVADLGGRGVKVRPNGLPAGVPVERTLDQIGRSLNTCGRAAAEAGVEIWVEVHGRGTDEPENVRTFMQRADHANVGITWNSNAADVRNGSIAESFKMLQPWIKSCHIHDLYEDYPYRELFRSLRQMNYDRWTLAEMPGMPTPAAAERFLRYYKAVWAEMAGFA